MEDEVITSVPELVASANRMAMEVVEIHLVARGLLELIDAFRFRDVGSPIPAPGIADLPEEIRIHALEAMHAVGTSRILAETVGDRPDSDEVGEALTDAWYRSGDALSEAQAKLRSIAQIGLGLAQHAYDDDEVELLERAATGVFVRPGCGALAAADGFELVGSTRDEISVELAGMIARMICDAHPGSGFTLTDDSGSLLTVDSASDGAIVVMVGDGTAPPLSDRVLGPDGAAVRMVPGPMVITEVTASILDSLRAWGVDIAGLRVDWALWRGRDQRAGPVGADPRVGF